MPSLLITFQCEDSDLQPEPPRPRCCGFDWEGNFCSILYGFWPSSGTADSVKTAYPGDASVRMLAAFRACSIATFRSMLLFHVHKIIHFVF